MYKYTHTHMHMQIRSLTKHAMQLPHTAARVYLNQSSSPQEKGGKEDGIRPFGMLPSI